MVHQTDMLTGSEDVWLSGRAEVLGLGGAARPRRRDDRIAALFAAVHESPCGTERTSGTGLTMSVLEGKADLPVARPDFSV